MKYLLKITGSRWLDDSHTKMIHDTENGKQFLGPPIEAGTNETIIVEASDGRMPDGYCHIIKILGRPGRTTG